MAKAKYIDPGENIRIGQLLTKARKKKNLSRAAMAEKIGISLPMLSLIETGKSKASVPVLLGYCTTLHMTPTQILEYEPRDMDDADEYLLSQYGKLTDEQKKNLVEIPKTMG